MGSSLLGLAVVFVSGILFSVAAIFISAGSRLGVPAMQMAFVRPVFQGIFVLLTMLVRRTPLLAATNKLRLFVVLRGAFGGLAFAFYFATISMLPIGDAVTMLSMYPIFTVFIAACFLGEKITPTKLLAIALSVAGAICIARGAPTALASAATVAATTTTTTTTTVVFGAVIERRFVGYACAAMGTALGSWVFIFIRAARDAATEQLLISWCFFSIVASVSLALTAQRTTPWVPLRFDLRCGAMFGSAAVGSVAHALLNWGGQRAPASLSAIARTGDVAFAFLWEVAIFHQVPTLLTVFGAFAVVSGIGLIALAKVWAERGERAAAAAALKAKARADEVLDLALDFVEEEDFDLEFCENSTSDDDDGHDDGGGGGGGSGGEGSGAELRGSRARARARPRSPRDLEGEKRALPMGPMSPVKVVSEIELRARRVSE